MRQLGAQGASFFVLGHAACQRQRHAAHIYNQSTAPGGMGRFKSILERIASRIDKLPMLRCRVLRLPLDPQRPLSEIYVIERLDSLLELPAGSFALLAKTHHAGIDVELGSEITQLLHDTEAVPPKP